VTATVGISSIRITWEAPAGETGITGYEAWAIPGAEPQSSHGMVSCTGLTATSRSCVIGVAPGERYSVGVAADNGHRGESAFVVSAVVPGSTVPDAVPAGDAPLATDKGAVSTVTAGQSVTLVGDGYLPGSTVTLVIYSTPTVLGTVVADANGKFTATVTVPAGLAAGSHSLVASGVDSSGAVRYLRMNVTVSAAGVATASSGGLALTGFTAFPFVAGGLLALAAGAGLLTAARRRAR
jgi:titin